MGNDESSAQKKNVASSKPSVEASTKPKNVGKKTKVNRSRRPSSRTPAMKREIMETFGSREQRHSNSINGNETDGFVPPSQFMGLKRTKSDMGVHEDVISALSSRLGSRRVSISNDDDQGNEISKVVAEAAARVKAEENTKMETGSPSHGIKQNVSSLLNRYRGRGQSLARKKSNIVVGSSRQEGLLYGGKELTAKTNQWSSKEEDYLKSLVEKHGSDWKVIAEHLPGRSHTQCQNRWNRMLKPGVRKGTWTTEEDEKLVKLVKQMPKRNWGDISALIEGRSAKQCRERWCYNLDPSINKNVWTPAEDQTLIKAQSEMGNRWAHIASLLPGRTENAVKTRFKSIMRAKKREWSQEEDDIILKMHQQLGSRWETIAERLPNRTKNAVKTRFRVLGKGVTREAPEVGAPNQILHSETTSATLAELTQKVAEEHKLRSQGGNQRSLRVSNTRTSSTKPSGTNSNPEMSIPDFEPTAMSLDNERNGGLGNIQDDLRRLAQTDQGGQSSILPNVDPALRGHGNISDVVAAASAAASQTHQNSLLSRLHGNSLFSADMEESLEDAFTSVHAGQQVDDELIDFLDMWNQGSNVENTIM